MTDPSSNSKSPNNWQRIREVQKGYPWFYKLLVGLMLIIILFLLGRITFEDFTSFDMNVFTEIIGIGLTYLVIEVVVRQNAKREAENQRKKSLILQLGSKDNSFALEAKRQLKSEKWLYDGSLRGINLIDSNLQDADLSQADMQEAWLYNAKLNETTLFAIDLKNSRLDRANLESALLMSANLQNANLSNANLQRSNLFEANLEGANLGGANLTDAEFIGANLKDVVWHDDLSGAAILPDGSKWEPGVRMSRFTDREDPDFFYKSALLEKMTNQK